MAKAKQTGGYLTYSWGGDHDPVIDWIKTLAADEGVGATDLADDSGMARSTLYGWFDGKVKQPRHSNIKAVVRALPGGYDYAIVKNGRVVKMNGRTK